MLTTDDDVVRYITAGLFSIIILAVVGLAFVIAIRERHVDPNVVYRGASADEVAERQASEAHKLQAEAAESWGRGGG